MSYDVTRRPMQECPHCGYEIDAHGPTLREGRAPKAGDFCICIACAGVSRYTAGMRMVPTTIEDPDLDAESRQELDDAIAGIRVLRRKIPDWPEKFRKRSRG